MLTSLQNPLVKQIRKLHTARGRREQEKFLLEGTHLLEEALTAGCSLAIVCCTPEWQQQHPDLWQQVMQTAQRSELVSGDVLTAMSTTVHPNGVVAVADRVGLHPPGSIRLGIALQTLQDPGNLGTIIRTSAAAGADGLWLSDDSVDLDHPKVLRATAGQWFRLPMQVSSDLSTDLKALQQQGVQIVATLPSAQLTYWQLDFGQPTLILLGNEGAGLSPELANLADRQVSIPLAAGVESLNVAIAAALLLYEAQRQRQSA